MLTSAALVLLMTGPGLALFYGGLVRKKNGRIDHVDVKVDDRTATVTEMIYFYKEDGGTIKFDNIYDQIDGNYVVKQQTGKVDVPHYNADISSSFANYRINVPIDDKVFDENG